MSQDETQAPEPGHTASMPVQPAPAHGGSNGATIEPSDGVEAMAKKALADEPDPSTDAQTVSEPSDRPVTPTVEVLSPEVVTLDPERIDNMAVNRTQVSVGLTGISFNRTRLSGGSGPGLDDVRSVSAPSGMAETAATTSAAAPSSTTEESPKTSSSPAQSSPSQGSEIEPNFEDVQLFSQFLVGLVAYGTREVMERIHYYDDEITRAPQEFDLDRQIDEAEEKIETLFRYWLIGTLMWGERTALSLSYRTYQKSIDIGGFALRTVDRTTDNFLLRPLRKPFQQLIPSLQRDSQARIAEGRAVEQRGSVLAEETLDDIVGDFIDYLSENPELVDLISTSGMGLAGTMMDNGRQVGAVTDNIVENLVHKIFRRPKRSELPPSPFEGKPQTMYDPASQHYTQDGKAKN